MLSKRSLVTIQTIFCRFQSGAEAALITFTALSGACNNGRCVSAFLQDTYLDTYKSVSLFLTFP